VYKKSWQEADEIILSNWLKAVLFVCMRHEPLEHLDTNNGRCNVSKRVQETLDDLRQEKMGFFMDVKST